MTASHVIPKYIEKPPLSISIHEFARHNASGSRRCQLLDVSLPLVRLFHVSPNLTSLFRSHV